MNTRILTGMLVLALVLVLTGCASRQDTLRQELTTVVPGESPEVGSPAGVAAQDAFVLAADTETPGIVTGCVEVRFVLNSDGTIARLPSGRPLILHEDIMRDLARTNLQQNLARYMQGTVVEGVSVATAGYLRNYLDEPTVRSFQQNIYRIGYRHELPALRELEFALEGNLLVARADVRSMARETATEVVNEALTGAIQHGTVDRDNAMEFLNQTLTEMGL